MSEYLQYLFIFDINLYFSLGNSSMRTISKGDGSASWSSVNFTPRKVTPEEDNVFSFREARVQEYLSSLSEAESSSRDSPFQKSERKKVKI